MRKIASWFRNDVQSHQAERRESQFVDTGRTIGSRSGRRNGDLARSADDRVGPVDAALHGTSTVCANGYSQVATDETGSVCTAS